MKTKIFLTLVLLLISAPYLFSQNSIPSLTAGQNVRGLIPASVITIKSGLDNSYIKTNYFAEPRKEKSPWLAAIFSALLPGAGEYYGKSYLKAAIFFGVEVAAWSSFTYFQVKGNNKTDDFEAFANSNWSVKRYGQWLRDQQFEGAGSIDTSADLETLRFHINQVESDPRNNFSHTLPEYYTQQYYEVIGKYHNYVAGWADAENQNITKLNWPAARTQMFDSYAVQRQDANDAYNIATYSSFAVILNHLLSAADAAWTVSIYNKKIKMETGFRIEPYASPFTLRTVNQPTFKLKVSF